MKKITEEELKTILEQHNLWLDSDGEKGKRANLTDMDLSYMDLSIMNLTRVDFTNANLSHANLRCANLYRAILRRADLSGANLSYTDLIDADLTDADLTGVDLSGANLTCANLTRANLTCANLSGADLELANLTDTILDEKEQFRKGIVLTEPMTVYKKAYEDKIITLEIPIGAKVFSINNKKRRSNKAKVIDMQGKTELSSMYDNGFKYHVGDEIEIEDFDEMYNVECGAGIHFFLNRKEAERFEY